MKEEDIEKYIEEKYNELSSNFLKDNEDEWSSEDQAMDLIESDRFIDYCEKVYNNTVEENK